jgi:hypothetical protein
MQAMVSPADNGIKRCRDFREMLAAFGCEVFVTELMLSVIADPVLSLTEPSPTRPSCEVNKVRFWYPTMITVIPVQIAETYPREEAGQVWRVQLGNAPLDYGQV